MAKGPRLRYTIVGKEEHFLAFTFGEIRFDVPREGLETREALLRRAFASSEKDADRLLRKEFRGRAILERVTDSSVSQMARGRLCLVAGFTNEKLRKLGLFDSEPVVSAEIYEGGD